MKRVYFHKILFAAVLSVILTSCSILGGQTAPTMQAADVEATLSAIKTQSFATVAAQFTQTAAALPTDTPYPTPEPITATPLPPTSTPIPTPTPYPTFVMPTLPLPIATNTATITLTPTSTSYNCVVSSQSPSLGKDVVPGYDFDMHWVVKNTGTKDWDGSSTDLVYDSGTKFQKYADGADFTASVASGKEIDLVIDMHAPSEKGSYSAIWKIVIGKTTVCTLKVELDVK